MKRFVLSVAFCIATVTGMFAQQYAADIVAKLPQVKRLTVSMVGTGGLFNIPTPVVSLKKEWIQNISATGDYLKINAGNEKRDWEILIAHDSIGNVTVITNYDKKAGCDLTSIVISINENFSTPAFADYIKAEYNKGEETGFRTIAYPGPFFPLGAKHSKIAELQTKGDVLGIIGTNGFEAYSSLGAVSVICKTFNKKKQSWSLAALGLGSPYGKDLGKLVGEKCTSGEVENIIFFGISVPPVAIDKYTQISSDNKNYLKVVRKDSDGKDRFIQYQKFSRAKIAVKKGKNMIIFF